MPAKKRTKSVQSRQQRRQKAQKNRLYIFIMILAAVLVVSATAYYLITRQGSDALTYKKCSYSPSSTIGSSNRSKYPVNGYFAFTTHDQCKDRKQLHEMRNTGAKNVMTFGSRLIGSSKSTLASSSEFRDFKIGNRTGYDHALRQTDGGKIRAVYTYSNKVSFSSNALKCGKRNGVQVTKGKMYTWWLFPVYGAYSGCTDPKKTYDLVVAYNPNAKEDADYNMMANAELLGMRIWLGLPWSKADPKIPYVADRDKHYRHTYGSFVTRLGLTWQQRYGKSRAFAGVYATQEMVIGGKPSIWQSSLDIYRVQSQVMSYTLDKSKRRLVISPYASVKQHPLSGAASSMRNMVNHAKAGSGVRVIIAPQDGVGTGQVPLSQTTALYQAAKKSGAWLTWANIEAFQAKRDSKGNRLPVPRDGKRLAQQFANARKAKVDGYFLYHWNLTRDSGVMNKPTANIKTPPRTIGPGSLH